MPNKPLTRAQAEALTVEDRPWLSCDDCFDRMELCAEALVLHGHEPGEPMRVHLAGCPACREETESLISLVAADNGTGPEQALRALCDILGLPDEPPTERRAGILRLLRRIRHLLRRP